MKKITEEKARKILKALMDQFDEVDTDNPEFRDALRTMSFHEAEEVFLYFDNLARRKDEFEDMRIVLGQRWANKKELAKMKSQEILAYYIEHLAGDLLYEKYGIIYTS